MSTQAQSTQTPKLEVKLKSGSTLSIFHVPFVEASELVSEALKVLDLSKPNTQIAQQSLLMILGSPGYRKAYKAVLGRCQYNGERIMDDTFEAEETRRDYVPIANEVFQYVAMPFLAPLSDT